MTASGSPSSPSRGISVIADMSTNTDSMRGMFTGGCFGGTSSAECWPPRGQPGGCTTAPAEPLVCCMRDSRWRRTRRGMPCSGVRMRRFGELEAVIMDRLWEWGRPVLVREMVDALHDDRGLAYTTVMTVMENLYRKGWLRRERDGRAWRYEPTGSRSGYTAALMSDALATSPDRRTALKHFALQMSPHDAALLREALD